MSRIPTFFEQDLDEAQAESLDAALQADPALAEALLAEAQRRYEATGLPEPRWAERRAKRTPKGWWALGILLAGGAWWALAHGDRRAQVLAVPSIDGSLPVVALPAGEDADAAPEAVIQEGPVDPDPQGSGSALAQTRQGQELGVVLRLKQGTDLEVDVRDVQGRIRRKLYRGHAEAGERRCIWDGLDERHQRVEPGEYEIVVRAGGRTLAQRVSLKAKGRI
jgi:hypothetical protein